MEPKHKELLAQCRQSLAQAMTEVDKVVELLEAAGALGPRDLRDLEAAGGGKAELLIALLLGKERDHFQDLRVALEKTQPHLLSILYLNGVAGTPAAAETAALKFPIQNSSRLKDIKPTIANFLSAAKCRVVSVVLILSLSFGARDFLCTSDEQKVQNGGKIVLQLERFETEKGGVDPEGQK
ncbi:hypothetical protein DUI87_11795 [Hirundo rustica rustica]|uniref:CARD domain-containing protein n=1 Tax=Hirundo rustica rustica TaxID=333673 RepID=A0A3M0KEQ3_HIRRU|nr:hypothetical protein DUI87_11795 [Hirundo rustica rustica]